LRHNRCDNRRRERCSIDVLVMRSYDLFLPQSRLDVRSNLICVCDLLWKFGSFF